jgi:uncharacterized UBP type Zn finger protein
MDPTCAHLERVTEVAPLDSGCTECLRTGSRWVHLRLCMSCGTVACCNDSPNRHATAHHRQSGHPVIRSFEHGERWLYCYPDDAWADPVD